MSSPYTLHASRRGKQIIMNTNAIKNKTFVGFEYTERK